MSAPKHIVVITENYPTVLHPNRGTFVCQLVHAFAEAGVCCTVIHPWKLHLWLHEREKGYGKPSILREGVQVYRPLTLSLSNRRIGWLNTFDFTDLNFRGAVWRVLRHITQKPDALYGHFLYSAGATAVWAAHRLGCPAFVAVGESISVEKPEIWTLRDVRADAAKELFANATGFVTVSNPLRHQLIADLGVPETKIGVFPNGIDRRRFYPRDRNLMRSKYALPRHTFLVAFVGRFDERKGAQRVCRALEGLPGVGGIYIGDGPQPPKGTNVVFRGSVPHEMVPELLSAADAFVLPSRAEGSSNATLEAMACGLPVVISARPFNESICDEDSGWLVEPNDVQGIRDAVVMLQNNTDLRQRLGNMAFSRAARFDIQARAHGILEWMERKVAESRSLGMEELLHG